MCWQGVPSRMRIRIFFTNIESTSNVESFIVMRLEGINSLLSPGYEVSVHLSLEDNFKTLIVLDNTHHHYAFSAEAETLSESCSKAIHLTNRFLREQQRLTKKRFNQYFGEIS